MDRLTWCSSVIPGPWLPLLLPRPAARLSPMTLQLTNRPPSPSSFSRRGRVVGWRARPSAHVKPGSGAGPNWAKCFEMSSETLPGSPTRRSTSEPTFFEVGFEVAAEVAFEVGRRMGLWMEYTGASVAAVQSALKVQATAHPSRGGGPARSRRVATSKRERAPARPPRPSGRLSKTVALGSVFAAPPSAATYPNRLAVAG